MVNFLAVTVVNFMIDTNTLGLAQTKTAKALGLTYTSVSKYWNMSKEDYAREAEQEKYHMDNYRQ